MYILILELNQNYYFNIAILYRCLCCLHFSYNVNGFFQIPFSKFFFSNQGRIRDAQYQLLLDRVTFSCTCTQNSVIFSEIELWGWFLSIFEGWQMKDANSFQRWKATAIIPRQRCWLRSILWAKAPFWRNFSMVIFSACLRLMLTLK